MEEPHPDDLCADYSADEKYFMRDVLRRQVRMEDEILKLKEALERIENVLAELHAHVGLPARHKTRVDV